MEDNANSRPRGPRAARLAALTVVLAGTLLLAPALLEPRGVGEARAPDPLTHPEAVLRVYGADVWGLRGRFAIHTWVATKPRNASQYQIFEVIGWRARRGRPVLSVAEGDPARDWFGSPAILLHEASGPEAEALIEKVHDAVASYPFIDQYTMWPGPNSNSFVAWIGLSVPELGLQLPAKAVGQAWMKRNFSELLESGKQGL